MEAEASGIGATLTVGPTSGGMVRILVEDGSGETAMDLEPEEAEEIAEELRGAAERAQGAVLGGAAQKDGGR